MLEAWLNITEYNWVYWVAGLFALFEFFKWLYTSGEWLFKHLGIETKGMREKRIDRERIAQLEQAVVEIKETSKHNVEMFLDHERAVVEKFTDIKLEIISEIASLHEKIEQNNQASIETDCAMLRDSLHRALRYFSREENKDEQGRVHISARDYENLNGLFEQYFKNHGNSEFEKAYTNDFQYWIIDR